MRVSRSTPRRGFICFAVCRQGSENIVSRELINVSRRFITYGLICINKLRVRFPNTVAISFRAQININIITHARVIINQSRLVNRCKWRRRIVNATVIPSFILYSTRTITLCRNRHKLRQSHDTISEAGIYRSRQDKSARLSAFGERSPLERRMRINRVCTRGDSGESVCRKANYAVHRQVSLRAGGPRTRDAHIHTRTKRGQRRLTRRSQNPTRNGIADPRYGRKPSNPATMAFHVGRVYRKLTGSIPAIHTHTHTHAYVTCTCARTCAQRNSETTSSRQAFRTHSLRVVTTLSPVLLVASVVGTRVPSHLSVPFPPRKSPLSTNRRRIPSLSSVRISLQLLEQGTSSGRRNFRGNSYPSGTTR